jgi:hypothetical protein
MLDASAFFGMVVYLDRGLTAGKPEIIPPWEGRRLYGGR